MSYVIAAGSRLFSDTRRLLLDTDNPDKMAARVFALVTSVVTLVIAFCVVR